MTRNRMYHQKLKKKVVTLAAVAHSGSHVVAAEFLCVMLGGVLEEGGERLRSIRDVFLFDSAGPHVLKGCICVLTVILLKRLGNTYFFDVLSL